MKLPLQWFNEILFGNWMPWQKLDFTDAQWTYQLSEIKPRPAEFQERYATNIAKPVQSMTKFYKAMVDAQIVAYINVFHHNMKQARTSDEKAYLVYSALTRTLPRYLKDLAELMILINETMLHNVLHQKNIDYIFTCLRANTMRIYLEIQDAFPDSVTDEIFTETELIEKYFYQFPETTPVLKKLSLPELLPAPNNSIQIQQEINFSPAKGDVRFLNDKIMSYPDAIKDPVRFAVIESQLFENGLIDNNYNYIPKQGQQKILAAVYALMFIKKYFNDYTFKGGRQEINFRRVKAFLNYRYTAKVDKEARNFVNSPETLKPYIDKNPWLSLLFKV